MLPNPVVETPLTNEVFRTRQRMMTWQLIQSEVLHRIRSGRWKAGDLIPTEIELAAEFGCARATINRALTSLAASGLLERRRKVGTRVAAHPPQQSTMPKYYLRDEIEAKGASYGYRLLSIRRAVAPLSVLQRMMGERGAQLIELRSLFSADGTPYCCEERWIDPQFAENLDEDTLRGVCAEEWLDSHASLNHGNMSVSATSTVQLEPFVGDSLAVPRGAPVLQIERVSWSDATAVTLARQYFPQGHALQSIY